MNSYPKKAAKGKIKDFIGKWVKVGFVDCAAMNALCVDNSGGGCLTCFIPKEKMTWEIYRDQIISVGKVARP